MYCEYFGLKELPFSIAPNPNYLYMSQRHQDALAHLLYGIQSEGGFMLLTGEVGTGKTTLCRSLLEQIPEETNVAFILNPCLGTNELLQAICKELGIVYRENNSSLRQLTELIYRYLLNNHSKGRNTVLIIDEAQHLQFKTLELIRLLTNLETNTKKLLQIIFIGQPELNTLLAEPRLRQLSQRITARFHIAPLSPEETHGYIRYRLKIGGLPGNQEIFPDKIIQRIHKVTGGIPRLINVLCDRALLGTYVQNKYKVDKTTLEKALVEVKGESTVKRRTPYPLIGSIAAALCLWFSIVWFVTTPAPATDMASEEVNQITDIKPRVVIDPVAKPTVESLSISNSDVALSVLLNHVFGMNFSSKQPCQQAKLEGIACDVRSLTSWQELKELNRPVVLNVNVERQERYLVVSAIDRGNALVLNDKGEQEFIPLLSIGEYWTGNLTFLWRPPVDFQKPLTMGDKSATVTWLADAFSVLDNKDTRLTDLEFNLALSKRVKLFQNKHKLTENGIVDVMTLLRLNEELGRAIILNKPTPHDNLGAN